MSDIVIDADIMRSAGTSDHPHSRNARKVLNAISNAGHRLVQSEPLKAEYERHQGRFAATWRVMMISRKKWVKWTYAENANLRALLISVLPEDATSQRLAVLKDAHLLEIAAATGGIIVSKDGTALELFRRACPNLRAHRNILWGDLTAASDFVIEWISKGCVHKIECAICPGSAPKNAKMFGRIKDKKVK